MATITRAPRIDYNDLDLDKSGIYFVLSPRFDQGVIEVEVNEMAYSADSMEGTKNHIEIVQGHRTQDIYTYIIKRYESKLSKLHCAYLGKELKKCELALALGVKDYFQE